MNRLLSIFISWLIVTGCTQQKDELKAGFLNPPDSARPGVYWYFMDGNLSREGMTADLEAMKAAGIGSVLFLEVNVGVPRGKIDFLSEEWQELFKHAVKECERLGIEFILGSGPGWAGSGGPWVKPEQSMRHLVASATSVTGPGSFNAKLPVPDPEKPYFGERSLTVTLKKIRDGYYEDVVVLAFPAVSGKDSISSIGEKALYYRAPYTSVKNVKAFLPMPADHPDQAKSAVDTSGIIDLTGKLAADGTLQWNVPAGKWIILRFGLRNNGMVTRPAPMPGLGFECDKMDTTHFNAHFGEYIGKLIDKTKPRTDLQTGGWKMIHIDSWEMSSQNWSDNFREEFIKRRKYDPLKFLPVYTGQIVGSLEISERFLWDVRQTSMELVVENHAVHFRELGQKNGFTLSIEPYDMNPTADLVLGAVADVPMCEFWTKGIGFNSSFSCIEAASIAHVYGRPVVAAEAFTADFPEAWQMYPGNVKNQGDWAFCAGINKLVYHTFAHQPLNEKLRPGMTMGPYGVHWDRHQTWWHLSADYHKYIARCQYVLRQGTPVADILYLTPEGAPHVFRAPKSAFEGDEVLPDRRGYNFDGCSPKALMELADVKDGSIVFPGGARYRLLVLPDVKTMTPELLEKIAELLKNGANVVGMPPVKSPSLTDYPGCDGKVAEMAAGIWGSLNSEMKEKEIQVGKGTLYTGTSYCQPDSGELYPNYDITASILEEMNVNQNFKSSGSLRYIHRKTDNRDVYFVSNRTDSVVTDVCKFRVGQGVPELWNPVTGETTVISEFNIENGIASVSLRFEPAQSFFVVFNYDAKSAKSSAFPKANFNETAKSMALEGSWEVTFDTAWGGPSKVIFDSLTDWSVHPDPGIRYYSGSAFYSKNFDLPAGLKDNQTIWLDLGVVKNIARVKLNGKDLGVVWTAPWRVHVPNFVREKDNRLELEVVNLWGNRMIGDEQLPYDGVKDGNWPEWLMNNQPRTSGRFTFVPRQFYKKDSPLQSSGLLGPVTILATQNN